MRKLLTLILSSLIATSLAAHPHIFVDTGLELITSDAGEMTHVRVTWEYDEFYSLLITEDMGLDGDGDGLLTEAELDRLSGFDMNWIEGFNGDLVARLGETEIPLSDPQEVTASFAEGRITTTHLRAFEEPIPAGETLVMKAYDPTYYTAYELSRPVRVEGSGTCDVRRKAPKLDNELRELQQQLATLDAEMDPEDVGLPDIGAQMAGSVHVTCAAS
ncbi:DUF1007 family protein [Sulfitobacter aestuarii]|uniref:DUF1007 family protein n=1 Tax=Sulfitobacter aestuarii TaxID=2161676 RepID=A0ABW5U643_9RHOB